MHQGRTSRQQVGRGICLFLAQGAAGRRTVLLAATVASRGGQAAESVKLGPRARQTSGRRAAGVCPPRFPGPGPSSVGEGGRPSVTGTSRRPRLGWFRRAQFLSPRGRLSCYPPGPSAATVLRPPERLIPLSRCSPCHSARGPTGRGSTGRSWRARTGLSMPPLPMVRSRWPGRCAASPV